MSSPITSPLMDNIECLNYQGRILFEKEREPVVAPSQPHFMADPIKIQLGLTFALLVGLFITYF